MKIGDMRERVTLQQEVLTADGGGGNALAWTAGSVVWARVRPLSGREQAARGGLEAAQLFEVTIRRQAALAVTTGWRALWGGVPLNIRTVRNMDERNEYLTLECERGVGV